MNDLRTSNPETPSPESRAGFRGLNLSANLKAPRVGIDTLPLFDLLTIALLFSLLFSRMVITPGVRLELPQTDLRMPPSASAVAVLTVQNEGMLLFDGGVYQVDTIASAFQERVARKKEDDLVLLLKAGERLPIASLLDISAMAQEAGFSQVHLAAKRPESKNDGLEPNETETVNGYNFLTP